MEEHEESQPTVKVLREDVIEVKCPFCGTWFPMIARLIERDGVVDYELVDYGNGAIIQRQTP